MVYSPSGSSDLFFDPRLLDLQLVLGLFHLAFLFWGELIQVSSTRLNSRKAPISLFITSPSSSCHGFIRNQFNDLLPVGLLVKLLERCTGFAEVKGLNPVQA